jgi:uncharacterized protein
MIDRPEYLERLSSAIRRSPVTALLGPRQCGKTTLARAFAKHRGASFFDLESLPDRQRLQNPYLALAGLQGLVVLDEIQTMPELFNVLRVLADRPEVPARFLILGSASPSVIKRVSESLAGRVEFIELSGFDMLETGSKNWQKLWLRGGFPRSYLAESEEDSLAWREGFIRTYLERDIPQLGITIPAVAMRRFWTMLAHYHGQPWNASELARAMGLSDKTVRAYLDILAGTFMVRLLQPWHENIGKRQVKAPRVYVRDSGLLHSLLGLPDASSLLGHPKAGASWEGFALEEILTLLRFPEAYFWTVYSGPEIDLFVPMKGRRFGFEIKLNEAPKVTASMKSALRDLHLDHLWVIYPGFQAYPVDEKITVWPLQEVVQLADKMNA